MVKSEIKGKKDQTQEGINKSYVKLTIVGVVAVSILAGVLGWWQAPQDVQEVEQKAALPKEKSAEEIIAERVPRVPRRSAGENPSAGVLIRESAGQASGVAIKAPPLRPPVKPTQAPVVAPTVEMMAAVAPKGGAAALAVDAEGYATLPNGQRVKVSPASPAAPAFAATTTKEPSAQVLVRPQELEPGTQASKNKEYEETSGLTKQVRLVDAEGYALWPNGKRMTLNTKGLPVDAEGMMTFPDGKKVKAGETVYIRVTIPPEALSAAPTSKSAP